MEINTEMELCDDSPVNKKEDKKYVKLMNRVLVMWVKQQTIVHFVDLQSSHGR